MTKKPEYQIRNDANRTFDMENPEPEYTPPTDAQITPKVVNHHAGRLWVEINNVHRTGYGHSITICVTHDDMVREIDMSIHEIDLLLATLTHTRAMYDKVTEAKEEHKAALKARDAARQQHSDEAVKNYTKEQSNRARKKAADAIKQEDALDE